MPQAPQLTSLHVWHDPVAGRINRAVIVGTTGRVNADSSVQFHNHFATIQGHAHAVRTCLALRRPEQLDLRLSQ